MATKKTTAPKKARKNTSKAKSVAFGFQTVKGTEVKKAFVKKANSPIGTPLKNEEDKRLVKQAFDIIKDAPKKEITVRVTATHRKGDKKGQKYTYDTKKPIIADANMRADAQKIFTYLPNLQKTGFSMPKNVTATTEIRKFVEKYK